MFKLIDRFFHHLTIENWGFPWHILLCWGAVEVAAKIYPGWIGLLIVCLIAILYEFYQYVQNRQKVKEEDWIYQGWDFKKDMLQDLIANAIGVLLGIFL